MILLSQKKNKNEDNMMIAGARRLRWLYYGWLFLCGDAVPLARCHDRQFVCGLASVCFARCVFRRWSGGPLTYYCHSLRAFGAISGIRRFIREYDTDDRDPATSVRSLQRFRASMDALFLKGYILCVPEQQGDVPSDADQAPALLASQQGRAATETSRSANTITQIALEQCSDMLTVDVGGRKFSLWGKTTREDALAAHSEMKSVVRDMLGRLDADFSDNSLYICFECFDLESWERAAGDGDDASWAAIKKRLRTRCGRLCEVFKVPWSATSWASALNAALCERRLLGASVKPAEVNREAWARALTASLAFASQQGVAVAAIGPASRLYVEVSKFEQIIRFYLSVRDGTGDVERNFGCLKAIGHETGDVSYAEACLELITEGPQGEEELFERRGSSGSLLLTPFSRRCAELWQANWGKRYLLQKKRKDAGKKRLGGDKNRPRGILAVDKAHKEATKRLLSMAASDTATQQRHRKTILGIRRQTFEKHVGPVVSGRKISSFRATTKRRVEQRDQYRIWTGSSDDKINIRTSTSTRSRAPAPPECGSLLVKPWGLPPKGSRAKTSFNKLLSSGRSQRLLKGGSQASRGTRPPQGASSKSSTTTSLCFTAGLAVAKAGVPSAAKSSLFSPKKRSAPRSPMIDSSPAKKKQKAGVPAKKEGPRCTGLPKTTKKIGLAEPSPSPVKAKTQLQSRSSPMKLQSRSLHATPKPVVKAKKTQLNAVLLRRDTSITLGAFGRQPALVVGVSKKGNSAFASKQGLARKVPGSVVVWSASLQRWGRQIVPAQ